MILKKTIRNILLFSLPIISQGTLAALFQPNVTYDAADVDNSDGICADGQGNCTLRAAVQQNDALGGGGVIFLQGDNVYSLNSTLIMNSGIRIFGHFNATAELATIRPVNDEIMRVVEVDLDDPEQYVSLHGLRIAGGHIEAPHSGGGIGGAGMRIEKGSVVYLHGVEVVGNTADRLHGAGIANFGHLTLEKSSITDNSILDVQAAGSPQLYMGGGLYNAGVAKIERSSFINNRARLGGAIASSRGSLDGRSEETLTSIIASTFSNNRASHDGAAIYSSYSKFEVIGSTIIDSKKATHEEAPDVLNDVAVISMPAGDRNYDEGFEANKYSGEVLYNYACGNACHSTFPVKSQLYDVKPLFAYIDSNMTSYVKSFTGFDCDAQCVQNIAAYLKSDLYTPPAEYGTEVLFTETPGMYIATSIVVNTDSSVDEYKRGKSNPHSEHTIWGRLLWSDTELNDFTNPNNSEEATYRGPAELTAIEENDFTFEMVNYQGSTTPGLEVLAAKPINFTGKWRNALGFSVCKETAERLDLSSWSDELYCAHTEAAGNMSGGRQSWRIGGSGYGRFSIGAWE